jgi:RNA polymerase sigma factor (sigma-70 family)
MYNLLEKTDEELIKKIKISNDENCLKQLIERHSPLCNNIYTKYSSALACSGIYLDDVKNEKDYIVYKSAISFDPDKKSKFSTWLYNQVRYQCLNLLNSNSKYISMEEKDIIYHMDKNAMKNEIKSAEVKEYIFDILDSLKDKRISKIYNLRYFHGKKYMPWKKIGQRLKISTQTAINLHDKAINLLKIKFNSKNNFDKI